MWMDGWVMCKCTQDSQNVCTNLLLYLTMPILVLPFQCTLKHSSPLRQTLHTQIANHHINELENLFSAFFFNVGGFFKVPPSHMKVLPDHYEGHADHIKDTLPKLIPVATMGKCQANEFQSCHYGHHTLIIH